jgi:small subunit ribosomal protein S20
MPKTKSAKKALRQNIRRRARNLERKKKLRETLKKFKKLVAEKKIDEAKSYLPQVYKVLDKMAKVNFIKKGKADRLKSRLAKKLT